MEVSAQLSDAKRALLEARLRRPRVPAARIARRPEGSSPPLSYAQERIWFLEQYAPGLAAYHVALVVELTGPLDAAALRASVNDVVARHESLRMRFPASDGGEPHVVVDAQPRVEFDLAEAPDRDAALELARAAAADRFDLAAGPLMRAVLVRCTPEHHILALLTHHIVCDGWSADLVIGDLLSAYRARVTGSAAAGTARPVQYGDFAAWQRERLSGPERDRHLAYWKAALAAVPALELPTDRARPPAQVFDGGVHRVELDAGLIAPMAALGKEQGATLFMVLFAAWQVLLAKYSGQTDFAVGTPVAGRPLPELEKSVGMFNNMLAVRSDLDGDPAFTDLVARTRRSVLDALAHQELPFEHLVNHLGVARDPSRSPLFQATFAMQNFERRTHAADPHDGGPAARWMPLELPSTRFELELRTAETAQGLWCEFTYATALFDEATIERLAGHYANLLRAIAADPQARLSTLDVVGVPERDRLLEWGAAIAEHPVGTLHELFERHARATPEAVALISDGTHLTYREVNRRANRLAHALRDRGIGPDDLVALSLDRGPDQVVAILGVLKAGAAYVPLDPAHPAERLAFILADTAASVLVGTPVTGYAGEVLSLPENGPDHDPAPAAGPENLAYVIYTSGSTGRPKGVLIEHRQVVRLLKATEEHFDFGPHDVWILLHSYAFDFSVWEIWGALAYGGRLVVVGSDAVRDHDLLYGILQDERVTVLNQTPAAFRGMRAMLGSTGRTFADLAVHTIVFGGDALRVHELEEWFAQHGERPALVNMYGITETTVHVTAARIGRHDSCGDVASPIGRALGDLSTYVLDSAGQLAPIAVPGELYVGGAGLARGYLKRPELTAERFVAGPLDTGRLYRTGDRVRRLPDGTLEFLGRVDHQVKVRGYRIELGEIEAALLRNPDVSAVAVQARDDGNGDRRLIAYVVGDGEGLKEHLKAMLPDYMVPAAFVKLDALPLTPNGKLDARALPLPELGRAATDLVAPRSDGERAIAAIWCEVLKLPEVGVHDDFFGLGGHSLLATQVVARLRKVTEGTGRRIGVMDLFQHPTVAELAELLEGAEERPRRLLHELSKPIQGKALKTYVCIPYGGGPAAIYQPLADLLPAGHQLLSLAIPGHDIGLDESAVDFDELARKCAEEVLERTEGPLILYGHCGVGGAMIVALALQLEAAGRTIEAVYAGGIFPSARPTGLLARFHDFTERIASNRSHVNWLKGMGVDVDVLGPEQADRVIANMRHDGEQAEDFFTDLLTRGHARLNAPIISIVGERDPITDYYAERYREWRSLTSTAAVVVLSEGGHFFLRYRAREVAEILIRTHDYLASMSTPALTGEPADVPRAGDPASSAPTLSGDGWKLAGVSRADDRADSGRPAGASMRRFGLVAAGQLVSSTGSALTGFAIPIWVLQHTGSLLFFGLMAALAFLPAIVATPIAGALADRYDRRKILMAASIAALSAETLFAALLWAEGTVALGAVYTFVFAIALAGAFQRITFVAAIPQLVPKVYLGHANGIAQLATGTAMMFAPLLGAGLYAAIGLGGILAIDLASYLFAITVLLFIRFPNLMGRVRKETFGAQLLGGLRLTWATKHFRTMLIFYAVLNVVFAVPLLMVTPLVLAFGTMADVGWAAFAEAAGGVVGGLLIAVWGGPRRRMMVINILAIGAAGLFVAATGVHASLAVIAGGVFGSALMLSVANAIYFTVIQVKIPQRYHGRVIALNQTLAWSTFPLAFAVLPVLIERYLARPMMPSGALAHTAGQLIGTGPGRGIGLAFVIAGLLMAAGALLGLAIRRLSRLDADVPDAVPDDLVGVQELAAQTGASMSHRRRGSRAEP